MPNTLLQQLASTGIVGLLLALALFALRDMQRQLKEEMKARIEDAAKNTQTVLALQRELIEATQQIAAMLDLFRKVWERMETPPAPPAPERPRQRTLPGRGTGSGL